MGKERKKKKNRKLIWEKSLEQIKSHKKTFAIYIILRVFVVVTLILQIINKNYENAFLCILTLLLFLVPSFVEMKFKVRLPDTLEIIILLFIFAAEVLGEIQNFYGIFSHWDVILHTINGFLCAAIVFSLVDILNQSKKFHLNLTPIFVAIMAFCFSMTAGVVWEFFEYTVDRVFQGDMQKDEVVSSFNSVYLNEEGINSAIKIDNIEETRLITEDKEYLIEGGYLDIGLNDTMEDLFVNFIGALIFSGIGYVYLKKRKGNRFVEGFIVELV